MPNTSSPKTYRELAALVRGNIKAATIDATDPTDKGGASAKKTDGDDASLMALPTKGEQNAAAPAQLTDRDTNPAGVGEGDVPSTAPGDPKDKSVSSPTDALSKIAGNASDIANRIKGLMAPKAAPATEAAKEATVAAVATAANIELTPEFHLKLASTILSTQEGVDLALSLLRKQAGVEAANDLMSSALAMHEKYASTAQVESEAEQLFKSASAEEQAAIVKFAKIHDFCLSRIENPIEKMAFAQGAQDAAAMDESAAGGGEPQLPGGEAGGTPSPEEIVQVLQQMVQSGEIDEETAQQVLQILAQGGDEAAGDAAGGEDPSAAGAAPEQAAGGAEEAPEEVKAASAILYGTAE